MNIRSVVRPLVISLAFICSHAALTQSDAPEPVGVRVHLRLLSTLPGKESPVPAAVWLSPLHGTRGVSFEPRTGYTLIQNNRSFTPHLLVVPVGSTVQFPNQDPFFHNVFSLFDGKRFDLGLYEAGSSKAVTFPREGVSYIFCNIHPEMSAVILSLSTPLYAIADRQLAFEINNVPPGDYELHIWVEGVQQAALSTLSQRVHISSTSTDLGTIRAPIPFKSNHVHKNKYGGDYPLHSNDPY